jgi:hypothetical protein
MNPSSTATIVLDNRNLDFNGLVREGDEISVRMGYWGEGIWHVFAGYVQDASGGADYAIFAKDAMLLAHRARIVKAFSDVTPNDVATYCVKEAGYSAFDLGGSELPKKPHFVLRNANVTQAISLIERTWGIAGWGHYITPDRTFVWKKWEPESEIFTFETGKHIIAFEPYGDIWRLHTFLYPWIRHSSVVRVVDARVGYGVPEETFRVERVTLNYGPGNSMTLWLRKLSTVEREEVRNVWGAFQGTH